VSDPDPETSPSRTGPTPRRSGLLPLALGALSTVLVSALVLFMEIVPLGHLFLRLPPWLLWALGTAAIVAGYVVGALAARAIARRADRSVLDAHQSEQHLARARQELAAMEQAIADRSIEYAQLGEQLQDASAMLQLSEEQTAAVSREIEQAGARAKKAWWWSLLSFFVGIVFSYLVEWTAGPFKPPWFP
jgi:hypothetical protein